MSRGSAASSSSTSPARGLVIVYTGGGKGKTTAALGLAIRAIGHDWHVCMIQFIKGTRHSGEIETVKRLAPNFELIVAGEGFVGVPGGKKPLAVHKAAAKRALEISREKLLSGKYQVVILDEINYALSLKLLELNDVLDLILIRPPQVTLVLTGNNADPKVIEAADLVTEMKSIKHPFETGVPAIRGVDY
ncbi:MAG: cob(I)yrinic acid a,c-diamide adenosyltransferase [Thaumarchaeota archaeon]|nr:cob(I)yrinic acid a,c-diamide adenosyltransferase [Nitrososphaerota archaeon]MCL5318177.1 cob(I)yrinic acid a,c-diamide adenosyltransferase [Nitrososphaerota archaeon]